ncbi:hypothetical protein [Corallococcus aberystwythensis]|uniref:Uncharacterized protein n=1 Tax=Corallococcus aberystwythensis TaxID=2316722 RepID=A0A3A8PXJ1_9BACT|nr:hypothetical protein [Corallococcus aberystwythensis]RKH57132.1 hypothetical protein D7W81_32030 [Corallococcus aberystwythensis]
MAPRKKGKHWYGTGLEDARLEMGRFSQLNGYPATRFHEASCPCGAPTFTLDQDEDEGVARRTCSGCGAVQWVGDSSEYADSAELQRSECLCGAVAFQIVSGVALYEGTKDVRWLYVACFCPACGLIGVYADWKCEGGDADAFLART